MKIIKFIPWVKDYPLLEPVPSKATVPMWWRNGEATIGDPENPEAGMKTCIPFMEIMTSGYLLVAPFDIFVAKNEDGDVNIKWNSPPNTNWNGFIGERPEDLGKTIPRPAGHLPNGFTWSSQWSWKTPRGYSTFVTHPFNRYDLPFTTLNGIIDSDKFHGNGNIPFFLKEGFQGVIPAGTPIAQIFPFKRDSWRSWTDDTFNDKINAEQNFILRQPDMSYKKRFWVKKEFK